MSLSTFYLAKGTSPHTVALSALQDGENVLSVTASGGGVTFPRPLELTVTRCKFIHHVFSTNYCNFSYSNYTLSKFPLLHPASSSASYRTLSVNNGAYNVSWRVVGDVASFVLSARTTGWVGLGFSRNQQMVKPFLVLHKAVSLVHYVYKSFQMELYCTSVSSIYSLTGEYGCCGRRS